MALIQAHVEYDHEAARVILRNTDAVALANLLAFLTANLLRGTQALCPGM